jgi:major membrane immunogen (membrane-anchored lipoprotein)
MYHGAMGAMQGMSLQQIYDRIADVLWETQKAQVNVVPFILRVFAFFYHSS